MSEFQFEEENTESYKSRTILGEPSSPKMVKALLKTGIIKNEKHAGYILFGFAVACFILAIYIAYAFVFAGNAPKKLTPEQERQRQEFMERIREGQQPLPVNQAAPTE